MTTDAIDGPLHAALVIMLPTFAKEPFSTTPRLNVPELKSAVEKSHETVYKWLRTNRLNPRNAQKIIELANRPSNVDILKKLGRTPPRIEDLNRFVFA